MKRTAEGIIRIGQNLLAVKDRLDHGRFVPWIQSEFEMNLRTAQRFMGVASRFGEKYDKLSFLSVSVLYELAAPSTKEEVIDKVLSGEISATLEAIKEQKEAVRQRRIAATSIRQPIITAVLAGS